MDAVIGGLSKMDLWQSAIVILALLTTRHTSSQLITKADPGLITDVSIACNSNSILVTISTATNFNGMIYPKGLSKNSTCMSEYNNAGANVSYVLPLRSCNTMSTDMDDGVEYFNTVVIQPHRKLVTNQGRGYHIRCRYQTKEKTVTSSFNVSMIGTTPLVATAPMPVCSMKIYLGDPQRGIVAENVRIGDQLTLVITIDLQDVYGMKVTNCIVRDGMNWGEQPLINNDGCPVDEDIMGSFNYTLNITTASVGFPAHKFPYTSSVYYQCNVKLCLKQTGGCDDVPPDCSQPSGKPKTRKRRNSDVKRTVTDVSRYDEDVRDLTVEVYSGLYVNEVEELEDKNDLQTEAQPSLIEDEFCVSTRKFAIGIAIAGVLLMLAIMLLVACLLRRRRRRKDVSSSGSSIYSGPYSNHAYTRD